MQFRESTQFPPLHQGTTYVKSYTDETSTTNHGLYQEIDLTTKELVSQYIRVNNKKIELSTLHSVDDALEMIKQLNK
jgi:hypothetical protein